MLSRTVEATRSGYLPAEVHFVFCNRDPGEHESSDRFMELVRGYGFPLVTFSSRGFRASLGPDPDWRMKYDRQVIERLAKFRPDLCVLAGYMLIVDSELCHHFAMVNLHPAAPQGPKGSWQEVIWKLVEQQETYSGAKMHIVTEELDAGPVISFCTFPIRGDAFDGCWRAIKGHPVKEVKATVGEESPLFKLIRQHGVVREQPLVIETLKVMAEGNLVIQDSKGYHPGGHPASGMDLTEAIERNLKQPGT